MLASILVMALIVFVAAAIGWWLGYYLVGPALTDWLDDRNKR